MNIMIIIFQILSYSPLSLDDNGRRGGEHDGTGQNDGGQYKEACHDATVTISAQAFAYTQNTHSTHTGNFTSRAKVPHPKAQPWRGMDRMKMWTT